ncbi:hypothetical protein GCM10010329_69130 [Streptomyces spiroverticillatus]|uniref:Acyl-CoA carboxylase subunit epsilon n=1 Tax=Streptomyces finlayi TaxID=67296 RepID=A0A918X4W9_9ACTN|nr:acyl-CoA carboxylase epsilon subunit [Streptomyces finlayi]GHA36021.1 hypothetical protein GCM10010329_69130 [Streptomyces spiroverticillatus]GHD12490.1 hypothetical protein GCM10010334_69550 [Streptomyces finlayi]
MSLTRSTPQPGPAATDAAPRSAGAVPRPADAVPRSTDAVPRPADDVPLSTALAMASFRISRGNPTTEETAAVAAVLMAGLRRLHDSGPAAAAPRILRLPHPTRPAYRAPGSWAS